MGSEKKIGKCTAENGAFKCVVTEDIAATLGGNGSLKNGFVKLEAVLTKSSVGKTTPTSSSTVRSTQSGWAEASSVSPSPRRRQVLLV